MGGPGIVLGSMHLCVVSWRSWVQISCLETPFPRKPTLCELSALGTPVMTNYSITQCLADVLSFFLIARRCSFEVMEVRIVKHSSFRILAHLDVYWFSGSTKEID